VKHFGGLADKSDEAIEKGTPRMEAIVRKVLLYKKLQRDPKGHQESKVKVGLMDSVAKSSGKPE
jgi:hypothetical protein